MTAAASSVEASVASRALKRRAIVGAAVLVLVLLAVRNNIVRDIWMDEAYSLDTARRTLFGTVRQAIAFELQPPLYFILLNLWLRISPALEFARLLSTLFAVGSLLLVVRMADSIPLKRVGPWSALVMALVPYVIWCASEARGYALTLLLCTALTWQHARMVARPDRRQATNAFFYGLLCILALSAFYYTGLLIAAQLLALFAERRMRWSVSAVAVVLALALAAWTPILMTQIPSAKAISTPPPPVSSVLDGALEAFRFIRYALLRGHFLTWTLVELALPLAIVAAVPLFRWSGWSGSTRMITAALISFLLPALALGIAHVTGAIPTEPRYFVIVVPSGVLLLLCALDGLDSVRMRQMAGASLLLFLAVCTLSFELGIRTLEPWRQVADLLREDRSKTEKILVFDADAVLPLRYYYPDTSGVVQLPRPRSPTDRPLPSFDVASVAELGARVRSSVGVTEPFWLVQRNVGTSRSAQLMAQYARDSLVMEPVFTKEYLTLSHVSRLRSAGAPSASDR